MNLSNHLLLAWLCLSSFKLGTHKVNYACISFVVSLGRSTMEDYLFKCRTLLVPAFVIVMHNQPDNKCLPVFV